MSYRHDQEYLNSLLEYLQFCIDNNLIVEAMQQLDYFINLRPECVITVENLNVTQITPDMQRYIEERSHKPKDFNQEIYDKLLRAGNSEPDSKYGATGTMTLQEAVEKIKKSKQRR